MTRKVFWTRNIIDAATFFDGYTVIAITAGCGSAWLRPGSSAGPLIGGGIQWAFAIFSALILMIGRGRDKSRGSASCPGFFRLGRHRNARAAGGSVLENKTPRSVCIATRRRERAPRQRSSVWPVYCIQCFTADHRLSHPAKIDDGPCTSETDAQQCIHALRPRAAMSVPAGCSGAALKRIALAH